MLNDRLKIIRSTASTLFPNLKSDEINSIVGLIECLHIERDVKQGIFSQAIESIVAAHNGTLLNSTKEDIVSGIVIAKDIIRDRSKGGCIAKVAYMSLELYKTAKVILNKKCGLQIGDNDTFSNSDCIILYGIKCISNENIPKNKIYVLATSKYHVVNPKELSVIIQINGE